MYVYEVLDHQLGKIIGIYATMDAAISKIAELNGKEYEYSRFSRYKVWPNYVKDVIYEANSDFTYQEDIREREYDDFDYNDINAVPF